jgi:hypothetical protein
LTWNGETGSRTLRTGRIKVTDSHPVRTKMLFPHFAHRHFSTCKRTERTQPLESERAFAEVLDVQRITTPVDAFDTMGLGRR